MHYEEQTVSLRTLIQWGLEEDTERRIAALPPLQEIEALLGDTAAFRRRVLEAAAHLLRAGRRSKRHLLRVVRKTLTAAAILVSLLVCVLMANASVRAAQWLWAALCPCWADF